MSHLLQKKISFITFINSIYKRVNRNLYALILASFLLGSFHNFIHNDFDHLHDSSCSVYVLEQLYFAGDILALAVVIRLFYPFVSLLFMASINSIKVEKQFAIRAPPSF